MTRFPVHPAPEKIDLYRFLFRGRRDGFSRCFERRAAAVLAAARPSLTNGCMPFANAREEVGRRLSLRLLAGDRRDDRLAPIRQGPDGRGIHRTLRNPAAFPAFPAECRQGQQGCGQGGGGLWDGDQFAAA